MYRVPVLHRLPLGANAGRTGQLAAVLDRCRLSWALCGGDLVRSGVAATKEEMEGDFAAVEGRCAPCGAASSRPLGNHDGSWGQAGEKLYAFNSRLRPCTAGCCGSALALPGGLTAAITIWMTRGEGPVSGAEQRGVPMERTRRGGPLSPAG